MYLNLYLDDCSNSDLLAKLLRQAGHRVIRPSEANGGLTGENDDVHFAYAVANGFTIVTKNPSDFRDLHFCSAHHAGIFAIYQDNNPDRDMSDADIVRAIANVIAAKESGGEPIEGTFHNLNDWRY